MSLEESLKFPLLAKLRGASPSGLNNVTRPTLSGCNWLAVPADCVGIAYFVSPSGGPQSWSLQSISVVDDSVQVQFSTAIPASAVNVAASSDGRLVVGALTDGSLRCYNATSTGFHVRWVLSQAHSHVVPDLESQVPSTSREQAASGAGPVRYLGFLQHTLVVVDATRGLSLYRADQEKPVNLISNSPIQALCASCCPSSSLLAVGWEGKVHLYSYDPNDPHNLKPAGTLDCPNDDGNWKCTHLEWSNNTTLVAGFCEVIASEEESGDDEDEDDVATHTPELHVLQLAEDLTVSNATNLGDVVPFFSIPKHGRHVYFTASAPKQVVFVASNVASDVGVVANIPPWQICEIPEGDGIMTPTNEDDEFAYPTGLAILQVSKVGGTRPTLLLASTDGCLSAFSLLREDSLEYFEYPHKTTTILPSSPIPFTAASPVADLTSEPPELTDETTLPPSVPTPFLTSMTASPFGSLPASELGASLKSRSVAYSGLGTVSESSAAKAGLDISLGPPSSPTSGLSSAPFGSATAMPDFGAPSSLGAAANSSVPVFGSRSSVPVFGSGASIPTFGSGTSAVPLFRSTPSPFGAPKTGTSSEESPFDLFKTKSSPSAPWSAMAKPLFGTSPVVPTSSPTGSTPVVKTDILAPQPQTTAASAVASSSAVLFPIPQSEAAKNAIRVFDQFDTTKAGTLPVARMEDLLDELGEGFHGDELQEQLAKIDVGKTGQLERPAFVTWYHNLIEGSDRDSGKLSNDDDSERREEENNAREAFLALARNDNGFYFLEVSEFENLLESMGTTYCDESHSKFVKALTKQGRIGLEDFVQWYVQWVFDDTSSDVDEPQEARAMAPTISTPESGAIARADVSGWGDTFKTDKTQWKCEVCMISNKDDVVKCSACEAPRPGYEAKALEGTQSLGKESSGVGPQGFTFGVGSAPAANSTSPSIKFTSGGPTDGAQGFTFGIPSASASVSSETPGKTTNSTGFAFGFPFSGAMAPGSSSAPLSDGLSRGATPSGVLFGLPTNVERKDPVQSQAISSAAKAASLAFDSIDTDKIGTLPSSKMEALLEELGEAILGDDVNAQVAMVDAKETGQLERAAFISWYENLLQEKGHEDAGESSDDESDRKEEERNARESFMRQASKHETGEYFILASSFAALLESMGTTYGEEFHGKLMDQLVKDGKIFLEDFVTWYVHWIFDDSGSEDEKDIEIRASESRVESNIVGWGDTFKTDRPLWKCLECMVWNKEVQTKCSACETPRPGLVMSSVEKHGAGTDVPSGKGQGFKFGVGSTAFSLSCSSAKDVGSEIGFKFAAPGFAPAEAEVDVQSSRVSATSATDGSAPEGNHSRAASPRKDAKSSNPSPTVGLGSPPTNETTPAALEMSVNPNPHGAPTTSHSPMSSISPMPFTFSGKPTTGAKEGLALQSGFAKAKSQAPIESDLPQAEDAKASDSTIFKTQTRAANSSYPPKSSKAPDPFSFNSASEGIATLKTQAKAPSSTAYPPTSSKPPKPFSFSEATSGSVTPKKETKPLVPSAPPVRGVAPNSFNFVALPVRDTSSSPSLQIDTSKEAKAKPTASSYPPVASKAPKPFSFGSASAMEKSPIAVINSSNPPLVPNAPNPLSFPSSSEMAKAVEKPAKLAGGYPPMFSKAPQPFSFASSSATDSAQASSTNQHKSTSTSSVSYPPLASKAPPAFSFASPPSATGVSGFSMKPSKSPQPTFTGSPSTAKNDKVVAPEKSTRASTQRMDLSSTAGSWGSSGYPPIGSKEPKALSSTPNVTNHDGTSSILQHKVSRSHASLTSDERSVQSKSIGTPSISDCARQFVSLTKSFHERARMLEKSFKSDDPEFNSTELEKVVESIRTLFVDLAEAESTMAKCKDRTANGVRSKSQALRHSTQARHLINCSLELRDSVDCDVVRNQPLDAESESYRRKLASKAKVADVYLRILEERCALVEDDDPGRALMHSLLATHRDVKGFLGVAEKCTQSAEGLRTTTSTSRSSRIVVRATQSSERSVAKVVAWKSIEEKFETLPGTSVTEVDIPSSLISDEMLSPPLSRPSTSRLTAVSPPRQSVRSTPLFSPPLSSTYRAQWDTTSTVDQEKAKASSFTLPRTLREVSFKDAARDALVSSGTTPEKLHDVMNVSKQGVIPPRSKSTPRDKKNAREDLATVDAYLGTPSLSPKPTTASSTGNGTESSFSLSKVSAGADAPGVPKGSSTASVSGMGLEGSSKHSKHATLSEAAFGKANAEEGVVGSGGGGFFSVKSDFGIALDASIGKPPLIALTDEQKLQGGTQTAALPEPQSGLQDYHSILTAFYQKHNPAKINEIPKTLERYEGRERELFEKLAQRYRVPNPLDGSTADRGFTGPSFSDSTPSPFPAAPGAPVLASSASPFSTPGPTFPSSASASQTPFSSTPTVTTPIFGGSSSASSPSPFGQYPSTSAPSPFSSAPVSQSSPFSTNVSSQSPFGTPSAPVVATASGNFGGRSPRDLLLQFYQQHNPSKIGEVDRLLVKYQGNEEQLFRNLAKRYNLDPSLFGLSATPSMTSTPAPTGFGATSGFGQPSPLGGGAPTFGSSPSPFGGGGVSSSSPGFGQPSTVGFGGGSAPTFGAGSLGVSTPTFGGGGAGGGGFGAMAGNAPTASFGSLAQTPPGFGGGGGGGFGSVPASAPAPTPPSFGMASPFGAPRR